MFANTRNKTVAVVPPVQVARGTYLGIDIYYAKIVHPRASPVLRIGALPPVIGHQ